MACSTLSLSSLPGFALIGEAAVGAPRPGELRVDRSVVPLPPAVTFVRHCVWTREGSALLCAVTLDGVDGVQVARVGPDGSGFRCLTCAGGVPGGRRPHKIYVFVDGRRFVLGTPPAGGERR